MTSPFKYFTPCILSCFVCFFTMSLMLRGILSQLQPTYITLPHNIFISLLFQLKFIMFVGYSMPHFPLIYPILPIHVEISFLSNIYWYKLTCKNFAIFKVLCPKWLTHLIEKPIHCQLTVHCFSFSVTSWK